MARIQHRLVTRELGSAAEKRGIGRTARFGVISLSYLNLMNLVRFCKLMPLRLCTSCF